MPALHRLPLILGLAAATTILAVAPSAAQTAVQTVGADAHRTDRTPAARDAPNAPRPQRSGAPVNANAADDKTPPVSDPRTVRPAEAFPPERIQASPPSRTGVDTPSSRLDDPRGVEERKDPEP